jgi:hypothetical protein
MYLKTLLSKSLPSSQKKSSSKPFVIIKRGKGEGMGGSATIVVGRGGTEAPPSSAREGSPLKKKVAQHRPFTHGAPPSWMGSERCCPHGVDSQFWQIKGRPVRSVCPVINRIDFVLFCKFLYKPNWKGV